MIGFIGLGIMGSSMAENLVKKGFELIVHNRTKDKAEELIKKGAVWVDSPQEVAEQADIVFTMLANPKVVEEVALGDNGFLNHIAKGKLWVDCSTVDPTFSRKMAAEAGKRGVRFMDAPVTGSRLPAKRGELVFLVGGSQENMQEVEPMLKAMGKEISYQGVIGQGTSMKVIINLMLAQSMAAFAEAVRLGEALGLEKETVVDTLLNGPTTAPFLKAKKDKVMSQDFSADFPLEHMQKDLQLVSQAAFENNIALPIANAAKELYMMAKQNGFGNQDFSAIYQLFAERKN